MNRSGMNIQRPPSAPKGGAEPLLHVAIVARSEEDREALSTAFTAHRSHRVACSCPPEAATALLEGRHGVDAIIGFADDQAGWRQFRDLTARFPDILSVLLVSDPDHLGARADGRVLNALVALPREELAQRAAEVTAHVVRNGAVRPRANGTLDAQDQQRLSLLSDRERDVLGLTASGFSIKEIARRINRSYATVATHRARIMEKLGLHDKVALTRFAIRVGLIEA